MHDHNGYKVTGAGNKVTAIDSFVSKLANYLGAQVKASDKPFTFNPFNTTYTFALSEKQIRKVKPNGKLICVSETIERLFRLVESKDGVLAEKLVKRYKQLLYFMVLKKACDADLQEFDQSRKKWNLVPKGLAVTFDALKVYEITPWFSWAIEYQRQCLTQQIRGNDLMVDFILHDEGDAFLSITIHSGNYGCEWEEPKYKGKCIGGPRDGEIFGCDDDPARHGEAVLGWDAELGKHVHLKTRHIGEYRFSSGRWIWHACSPA